MRRSAGRTLSSLALLAVLGAFTLVGHEVRAQGYGARVQVADPRDIRARPQEITISIRVDRLLGRIDVTTTIPVDDPPAVPRSRYDFPTASKNDGAMSCEETTACGRVGQCVDPLRGADLGSPTPTARILAFPFD